MKKIFALLLVTALILGIGASAFAATLTPVPGPIDDPPAKAEEPHEAAKAPVVIINGFLIFLTKDDSFFQNVPLEEVTNVSYDQEDLLPPGKRIAFAEAYKNIETIKGKTLQQAFWFDIPEFYTMDEEHYGKYLFGCEGKDIEVTVNGNPMEVVPVTGGSTYFAKLTERGVIAIYSK